MDELGYCALQYKLESFPVEELLVKAVLRESSLPARQSAAAAKPKVKCIIATAKHNLHLREL